MNKLLGKIFETFTIQADRIILIDRDCSTDIKFGEFVEVRFVDDTSTKVKVLDGFLDDGSKYPGVKVSKISSVRVEDKGFPKDREDILGSEVYGV